MRGAAIGAGFGVILAIVGLVFGFWGVLLTLVLGAIGALLGAVVAGELDIRAAIDAARGRRGI